MGSYKKQRCDNYLTFGTCKDGNAECRKKHEGDVWPTKCFLGTVEKICGKQMWVKKSGASTDSAKESYWVEGGSWATKEAEIKNMIIFQESEREHNRLKHGRVVLILGKNSTNSRMQGEVVLANEVDAFTLYPDDHQKDVYDAFSIVPCKAHGDKCKEIGIHVSAVAWDMDGQIFDLPPNGRSQSAAVSSVLGRQNENLEKFGFFQRGKTFLAISVYTHSSHPETISGPIFTPGKISEVYTFSEYLSNPDLELLWGTLQGDEPTKMLRGQHHWHYILQDATLFKPHVIKDEASTLLTLEIKKYFRKNVQHATIVHFWRKQPSEQEMRGIITGNIIPKQENKHYLMLGDHLERAVKSDKELKAVRWMLSSMKIMTFRETLEETSKISKFARDVKVGNFLGETVQKAVGTSMLIGIHPFNISGVINQQILINAMLGVSSYHQDDLLGCIVRRFQQPVLVKSLLRKLNENSLDFNYLDLRHVDPSLMEIPLGNGGLNADIKDDETSVVSWANFKCDEIEYDRVYSVCAKEVSKYVKGLAQREIKVESLSNILQNQGNVLPSPYQHTKDGTLKLDLIPGRIIRLQICNYNPWHREQIGLRMLRVGKNGHICLAHLNDPTNAFGSDRHDLQPFVSTERLAEVRAAFTATKLYPTESGIAITWCGKYNGDGWFTTQQELKTGDFLCLRKDVYEDERVAYVWNAHAVVTKDKIDDSKVCFSTCTLLQPGEMNEGEDFVVEYIKINNI